MDVRSHSWLDLLAPAPAQETPARRQLSCEPSPRVWCSGREPQPENSGARARREPLALSRMRHRLAGGGRPGASPPSPLARSLGSLSEKLGEQVARWRRSCKRLARLLADPQADRWSDGGLKGRHNQAEARPIRPTSLTVDYESYLRANKRELISHRKRGPPVGETQPTDGHERAAGREAMMQRHSHWLLSSQDPETRAHSELSSGTLVLGGTQGRSQSDESLISRSPDGFVDEPPRRSCRLAPPTSDYWSTGNSSELPYRCSAPAGRDYYPETVDEGATLDMRSLQPSIPEPDYLEPCDELLDDDDDDGEDYAVPSDNESWRLDRNQVELVQLIGEGQRGFVFLGKLQSRNGRHIMDVAVKTLKYETEELIEKLIGEASVMRQLEHPHIIRFIGVCSQSPALIAMELAQFGELKQYLRMFGRLTSGSQLVLYAFQLSTALSYLESKQFVHRDVAARNVLVCSAGCVKLADFGLTRHLSSASAQLSAGDPLDDFWAHGKLEGQASYVAAPRGKLPVRWLAPESLVFRRFTSASDVWMFAVCCWELFHLGLARPWAPIRNNQVLAALESGQRLGRPPLCPARLYRLLLQCWTYAPVRRPKFRDLKQSLWSIYLQERGREHEISLGRQQDKQAPLHFGPYNGLALSCAASSSPESPARNQRTNLTRRATHSPAERRAPLAVASPPVAGRRFERVPSHLLRKQRSQGSIVLGGHRPPSSRHALDDQHIERRTHEPSCPAHSAHQMAESSDEEPQEPISRLAISQLAPPALVDPTYDGLQAAGGRLAKNLQRRPLSPDCLSRTESEQQKLASIMDALRVAPMQARLRRSEPRSPPDETRDPQRREQREREQRARQLQVHRRLLGRILPDVPTLERGRRAEPQAVDQSLRVLENLISGGGLAGSSGPPVVAVAVDKTKSKKSAANHSAEQRRVGKKLDDVIM